MPGAAGLRHAKGFHLHLLPEAFENEQFTGFRLIKGVGAKLNRRPQAPSWGKYSHMSFLGKADLL